MPISELRASTTLEAMKSEGNDSVDTFIRHFSRVGESPVQWIQLLQALDNQDIPGWPLLSPLKVQMQKCEKCSQEFCSVINYRRHIRVHRRSLNSDKDYTKSRDLLGAFWDKLSEDKSKEIVSFKDDMLEGVSGLAIVKSLTSLIRKPGFASFPQSHLRAGAALLDIVQSRSSRFLMSSLELFSILDDASERTFLCPGTPESMRRYLFEGEAGKIGLEMKNIVAFTSFIVEQKLVKAWLADKDAEALRCQKMLVEEEEAAQKRQAELLERKRRKKLRQKEQKSKEQADLGEANMEDSCADATSIATTSSLTATSSGFNSTSAEQGCATSFPEPVQLSDMEEADNEAVSDTCNGDADLATSPSVEQQVVQGGGRRNKFIARWQVARSRRGSPNGFHAGHNSQPPKTGAMPKHGTSKDPKTNLVFNGHRVWTRKLKSENCDEKMSLRQVTGNEADQNKNHEVLIGSIAVTLDPAGALENCGEEYSSMRNGDQEKPVRPAHRGTIRSTVKLWRPVSRQGSHGSISMDSSSREPEAAAVEGNGNDPSTESCSRPHSSEEKSIAFLPEDTRARDFRFSREAAEAFLAQRWKEVLASDHVRLVLPPEESERPGSSSAQNPSSQEEEEARNGPVTSDAPKSKIRTKTEKGIKQKYIPKQKTIT